MRALSLRSRVLPRDPKRGLPANQLNRFSAWPMDLVQNLAEEAQQMIVRQGTEAVLLIWLGLGI